MSAILRAIIGGDNLVVEVTGQTYEIRFSTPEAAQYLAHRITARLEAAGYDFDDISPVALSTGGYMLQFDVRDPAVSS